MRMVIVVDDSDFLLVWRLFSVVSVSVSLNLPPAVQGLVDAFRVLPGVGEKTAIRYALYMLNSDRQVQQRMLTALGHVITEVHACERCGNLTQQTLCPICLNQHRSESSTLCVVESVLDLLLIERTNIYDGRYIVLGGVLSPLDGIGPDQLRIKELIADCRRCTPSEVIFGLPASLSGDATADYIRQTLNEEGMYPQYTTFARGMAVGGELVYTDEVTLARAIRERRMSD